MPDALDLRLRAIAMDITSVSKDIKLEERLTALWAQTSGAIGDLHKEVLRRKVKPKRICMLVGYTVFLLACRSHEGCCTLPPLEDVSQPTEDIDLHGLGEFVRVLVDHHQRVPYSSLGVNEPYQFKHMLESLQAFSTLFCDKPLVECADIFIKSRAALTELPSQQ
jgi:hypothetical protein